MIFLLLICSQTFAQDRGTCPNGEVIWEITNENNMRTVTFSRNPTFNPDPGREPILEYSGCYVYACNDRELDKVVIADRMNIDAEMEPHQIGDPASYVEEMDLSNLIIPAGWSDLSEMFNYSGISNLRIKKLDLHGWNLSRVENLNRMFVNCGTAYSDFLQTIDVSGWNTTNVKDMSEMFYGCGKLDNLDVSSWDTSSVTNMESMFDGCSELKTLNVSGWLTPNVTNMSAMFYECSSLTSLDVSKWNTAKVKDMSYMFQDCTNLTSLDISNWDTSKSAQEIGGTFDQYSAPFVGCVALKTLTLGEKSLKKNIFNSFPYNKNSSIWFYINKDPEIPRDPSITPLNEGASRNGDKLLRPNQYNYDKMAGTWTMTPLTITLNNVDEDGISDSSYKYDSTKKTYTKYFTKVNPDITLPKPVKTGYNFTGWTGDNGNTPQKDVTIPSGTDESKKYDAKWEARTYTVKFDGNSSTSGSMDPFTFVYDEEKELTKNSFARSYTITYDYRGATGGNEKAYDISNAVFKGWARTKDGNAEYGDQEKVKNIITKDDNETIDLYANWGNIAAVTLPSPTKTASTFVGWYLNDVQVGGAGASYMPDDNRTLYAKWITDINAPDITILPSLIPDQEYTGNQIKPDVTIYDGETLLKEGADYTITYSKNTDAGENTAVITIKGKGNYNGERTLNFTIKPKPVKITSAAATNRDYKEGDTGVEISSVTFADTASAVVPLVPGTDFTVTGKMEDDSAGTDKKVTVTVTLTNPNYTLDPNTDETTVTINKIPGPALSLDKYVYTDLAQTDVEIDLTDTLSGIAGAAVTSAEETSDPDSLVSNVKTSGSKVIFDTASVAEKDKKAVITAQISADNYTDVTVTINVITTDKDDADVSITGGNQSVIWGDTGVVLTASAEFPGTTGTGVWNWISESTDIAEIDSTTGELTIRKVGTTKITAQYESDTTIGTMTIILTVKSKTIDIPEAVRGLKWTGEPQTGVPEGDGYTLTGNVETALGNYTAEASLTDPVNTVWEDGTTAPKQISWTIEKADSPAAPVLSPAGGNYTDPQSVTITCETEGAVIHYTTDGTEPTADSPVYSGPIPVTENLTIKAIAVKDGMSDSAVVSAVYTIIPVPKSYTVTVENGTGSGSYTAGTVVSITADAAPAGETFDKWTSDDGVEFTDASSASTGFVMPAKDVTVTAAYKGEPMTLNVVFVNVDQSSSYGVPKEIPDLEFTGLVISIDAGDYESKTEEFTLELSAAGQPTVSKALQFDRKVEQLAPGSHPVTISGLPPVVYGTLSGVFLTEPPAGEVILWKYTLSARTEINEKTDGSGQKIVYIRLYLTWDNGSSMPEEPVVRALPEDEIGAYKLNEDGTKEYLLFHTYSLCMNWLGRDELCRGYERCFHKENPYVNPFVTP